MKVNVLSCGVVMGLLACGDKDSDTGADGSSDSGTSVAGMAFCAQLIDTFCYLSGEYTEDVLLTADYTYVLDGGVFIGDGTTENTLTIEPGVIIYGETSTKGFLTIRRNANIEAVGTAEAPIVFTSPQAVGSRARSDWGGLIINGNAPINNCFDGEEQLPCEAEGEGGTGLYGGVDSADSSGTLKYVRVEFGGIEISTENEVNGIAFQGVGSGTTVDYIQVHMNKDDGVEFFGGTVNVSHVVLTGNGDDSFDVTDGWTGSATDIYVEHIEGFESDRGFEMDNSGDQNDATPRSAPLISNVLMVGASTGDTGMLFREGLAGDFSNIQITGAENCIDVDQDATWAQVQAGNLTVSNAVFDCDNITKNDDADENPQDGIEDESFNASLEDWLITESGNTVGAVDATPPAWTDGWIMTDVN